MYWLPYGLTGEEATDEYFDSLLSKDVDDLTSEEIRHLFGYLRGADTIEKLQNEFFIQLQEKYFDSQDEMLSFASNWVDYFMCFIYLMRYFILMHYMTR